MPTKTQKRQSKRKPRTTARGGSKSLAKSSKRLESHDQNLASLSMVRQMGNVFPTRLRRKLMYCDQFTLASTVGTVGLAQFRINSLFDFDLSGTGHQPRGFDQLCSANGPYTKYRVMGISIVCQYISDNSPVMLISSGFSDTSTLPAVAGGGLATITGSGELPGWLTSLSNTYGSNVRELAFAARIADIESKTEQAILADDGFAAAYNASPTDLSYFSIQAQACSSGTSNLIVVLKAEFDVQFESPLLLAAS